MDPRKRVCLACCHQDDELFFAGALLNCREAGYDVQVLYITQGGWGHRTIPPAELKMLRIEEARRANAVFGFLPPMFLDYPDSAVRCTPELIEDLARAFRKIQPEIVLTLSLDDSQLDHAHAAEAVRNSVNFAGNPKFECEDPPARIKDIYCAVWEHRPLMQYRRKPEIYISFSEGFLQLKRKAALVYTTQIETYQRRYLDDQGNVPPGADLFGLTYWAELWGKEAGTRYAEGYTSMNHAGDWSRKAFPVSWCASDGTCPVLFPRNGFLGWKSGELPIHGSLGSGS